MKHVIASLTHGNRSIYCPTTYLHVGILIHLSTMLPIPSVIPVT